MFKLFPITQEGTDGMQSVNILFVFVKKFKETDMKNQVGLDSSRQL